MNHNPKPEMSHEANPLTNTKDQGSEESVDKVNSTRLMLKTLLHSVYLVINLTITGFAVQILATLTEDNLTLPPIQNLMWFSPCYITNWNYYLFQTPFLFISLIHDGLEWTNRQNSALASKICYWRDVIFSGLVVPYTCVVFTLFWSIYSVDRELVFPKAYDEVLPWWFNQCVHTNILALLVLETLVQPRRHPRDEKAELGLNIFVMVFYPIVYYSLYFITNRWLYEVFGLMTWWQICLFQCCIWALSYIFYVVQFPLNRLVHREDGKQTMIERESLRRESERGSPI